MRYTKEAPVFKVGPPYDIADSVLVPPVDLPAKEGETGYGKTIDKLQKPRYPKIFW